MRILVAEPDGSVLQSLEIMLGAERFNVYGTDVGEEALELGKLYEYDAITLELNMPDISGFEVIRRLRDSKISTPILVISSSSDLETRVKALSMGADDYLIKPFHKDEVVARLHAIARRAKGVPRPVITCGSLSLNLNSKRVTIDDKPVHLTGKEFQMLELFLLHPDKVQAKDTILNYMYGGFDEPEVKIIDVFVCKLRKKLTAAGAPHDLIETVWGRGYLVRDRAEEPVAA